MAHIRLVIIHSSVRLGASIKGALEGTRQFTVVPFADSAAAVEYLRVHPQDVIIVDMGMPDYPGEELVHRILELQPEVIAIASTSDSHMESRAVVAGAAGLLRSSFTARQVANLIEELSSYQITRKSASATDDGDDELEEELKPSPVYDRLVAEEPPLPGLGEGATVGDFITGVQGSASIALDLSSEIIDDEDDEAGDRDTPAEQILSDMADETLPWEADPFDHYVNQFRPGQKRDKEEFVREPEFLKDGLFSDSFSETTKPSAAEMGSWFIEIEEEQETATLIDSRVPNVIVDADEDEAKLDTTDLVGYVEPEDDVTLPSRLEAEGIDAASEESGSVEPVAEPEGEDVSAASDDASWDAVEDDTAPDDEQEAVMDDPQIARMAVTLTQTSLESTAESTLLTQGSELVAYAGQLADADIDEIMQVVTNSVEDLKDGKARMKFLTLSSNGLDYLVYSRRTAEDYVLSMVFAGKTPLKDIRAQGKRIASALEAVPDLPPEELVDESLEAESIGDAPSSRAQLQVRPGVDVDALVKHTFVWLVRDPDAPLSHPTSEAIESGLRVQLVESGWFIDMVDVEEDYVYLVARVPGDDSPEEIVRGLQVRAGRIAKAQEPSLDSDNLWAEGYYVLTPGRELSLEEIQQYINFYRS